MKNLLLTASIMVALSGYGQTIIGQDLGPVLEETDTGAKYSFVIAWYGVDDTTVTEGDKVYHCKNVVCDSEGYPIDTAYELEPVEGQVGKWNVKK